MLPVCVTITVIHMLKHCTVCVNCPKHIFVFLYSYVYISASRNVCIFCRTVGIFIKLKTSLLHNPCSVKNILLVFLNFRSFLLYIVFLDYHHHNCHFHHISCFSFHCNFPTLLKSLICHFHFALQ